MIKNAGISQPDKVIILITDNDFKRKARILFIFS